MKNFCSFFGAIDPRISHKFVRVINRGSLSSLNRRIASRTKQISLSFAPTVGPTMITTKNNVLLGNSNFVNRETAQRR